MQSSERYRMSRAEPAEFVVDRQVWTSYRPFLVLGSVGVVLGGLLAAVTGPLALPMGSWAAADLVLVVGVGQIVLAGGQAFVGGSELASWRVWSEVMAWNLGSGIVLVGGMPGIPVVVAVGGLVLLAALVIFATAVRGGGAAVGLYRFFTLFLAASVAVGVGLSAVRHG